MQDVQSNPDQVNPKGCWNAVDLNRIEKNTAYCAEWMLEQRIVRVAPEVTVRENDYWTGNMIPDKSEIDRILNNIRLLITYSKSNPAIASQLPTIYAATQINYVLANQIEYALYLMHDQPKLPLEYWTVKINNGIVKTIRRTDGSIETPLTSEVLVAEDEIVTIRGIEYGDNAQYQTFTYWSGQAEDIGMLAQYTDQETYFRMPYRNVEFTANFETHLPRTLTLTNGYISVNKDPTAESGPSTNTYFAGDEVMIIANVAASGKKFYEWTGTQEGLNNIVGVTDAEDPSTAILTMPDCDVSLAPHYVAANGHRVTVNGGTGSNTYKYKEYVTISANIPYHYTFVNWSGNTAYLSDITSPIQSFIMGDEPLTFTAHTAYAYSYNNVEVIDGLIRVNGSDVSQAGGLRQTNTYTLVPTPPDNTQGLYNWTIEGYGSVSGNTFTVGDGNAIITGHYAPYRTLTVNNINNASGTNTYTAVQGKNWTTVSTNSKVGDYRFKRWEENGTSISTSTSITLTAGSSDRTITAIYEYEAPPPVYTVTIVNKNNSGATTYSNITSGDYFSTSTAEDVGNYLFTGWSGGKSSSSTYIGFTVYRRCHNNCQL